MQVIKIILIVIGCLAGLYLLNDLIQILIAYFRRRVEIADESSGRKLSGMNAAENKTGSNEETGSDNDNKTGTAGEQECTSSEPKE